MGRNNKTISGIAIRQASPADTQFFVPDASIESNKLAASVFSSITSLINSIIPTGITLDYVGTVAPSGYVLASGRTIGNALSGATERANADTINLFRLLWNTYANTILPVSGGRGASADADFAANKTIQLLDGRGRTFAGRDNMGGVAANRITLAGSGINGTILGSGGGTETHSLSALQNAQHTHGYLSGGSAQAIVQGNSDVSDPRFQVISLIQAPNLPGAEIYDQVNNNPGAIGIFGQNTGIINQGTGAAHQNTQPTLVSEVICKL